MSQLAVAGRQPIDPLLCSGTGQLRDALGTAKLSAFLSHFRSAA